MESDGAGNGFFEFALLTLLSVKVIYMDVSNVATRLPRQRMCRRQSAAEESVPTAQEMHSRNFTLPRGERTSRWWVRNDPVATAFFNALSATFPQGERFFIESVKHYRDRVSPELRSQISV